MLFGVILCNRDSGVQVFMEGALSTSISWFALGAFGLRKTSSGCSRVYFLDLRLDWKIALLFLVVVNDPGALIVRRTK